MSKKMTTYKVCTKWIGYSEYTVKAESKDEAEELCMTGNSDTDTHTGDGLSEGYDDEQIIETKVLGDR